MGESKRPFCAERGTHSHSQDSFGSILDFFCLPSPQKDSMKGFKRILKQFYQSTLSSSCIPRTVLEDPCELQRQHLLSGSTAQKGEQRSHTVTRE